jgi:hypothetical protein
MCDPQVGLLVGRLGISCDYLLCLVETPSQVHGPLVAGIAFVACHTGKLKPRCSVCRMVRHLLLVPAVTAAPGRALST